MRSFQAMFCTLILMALYIISIPSVFSCQAYDALRLHISINESSELKNDSTSFYDVALKIFGVKMQKINCRK